MRYYNISANFSWCCSSVSSLLNLRRVLYKSLPIFTVHFFMRSTTVIISILKVWNRLINITILSARQRKRRIRALFLSFNFSYIRIKVSFSFFGYFLLPSNSKNFYKGFHNSIRRLTALRNDVHLVFVYFSKVLTLLPGSCIECKYSFNFAVRCGESAKKEHI